jgi:hypothetical protein
MDVSNNRLFRFSKPEWLNNSAVRNGGVYVSGALVSPQCTIHHHLHLHTPDTTSSSHSSPKKNSLEIEIGASQTSIPLVPPIQANPTSIYPNQKQIQIQIQS